MPYAPIEKSKNQFPLVGRGFPDAPHQAEMIARVMENTQAVNFPRREGALLLPAAGTDKYPKIQCEYVIFYGFSRELCEFQGFYRREKPLPYGEIW